MHISAIMTRPWFESNPTLIHTVHTTQYCCSLPLLCCSSHLEMEQQKICFRIYFIRKRDAHTKVEKIQYYKIVLKLY